MKIILYDKETIMINIICIVADVISICLVNINLVASVFLFTFSIIFNLVVRWKLHRKKKKRNETMKICSEK